MADNEILAVDSLSKRFGGLQAVDAVGFRMKAGTVHAVIGPNGAGKTTLFNLISGTLKPDSGSVCFKGRDITGLPPHRVARLGILRTFQAVKLCPKMSVLENAMLGMHSRTRSGPFSGMLTLPASRREDRQMRERALSLLEELGLSASVKAAAGSLPFGSQRMVELARCLAGEPELILLDEPASGLNMKETEDLTARIAALRERGLSVLLVEHDMSLVMGISDELTVLNFGKRIAGGAPREVQANPDVIRVYLGEEDA